MCIPYFYFPPVAVAAWIISDMAGTFYALRRGAEGPWLEAHFYVRSGAAE